MLASRQREQLEVVLPEHRCRSIIVPIPGLDAERLVELSKLFLIHLGVAGKGQALMNEFACVVVLPQVDVEKSDTRAGSDDRPNTRSAGLGPLGEGAEEHSGGSRRLLKGTVGGFDSVPGGVLLDLESGMAHRIQRDHRASGGTRSVRLKQVQRQTPGQDLLGQETAQPVLTDSRDNAHFSFDAREQLPGVDGRVDGCSAQHFVVFEHVEEGFAYGEHKAVIRVKVHLPKLPARHESTSAGMYSSNGFIRSDIGDVDVVYHDGVYHLFHLVLPNHDIIAHAISSDGMQWRRVPNAMFVGDPGAWDDDMLWTMHVTRDPGDASRWRMLYTGLRRQEEGRIQRIGAARSNDLVHWERQECETHEPVAGGNRYPLAVPGTWYESRMDEGRHWVSFRDPFIFEHEGQRRLLFSARVKDGPVVRRGCVGQAIEIAPDVFEFRQPLYQPGLYDDVEVPGLYELDGRFFLMGSIREDVKVHYWFADNPDGPFQNYSDNVLLPKGNYAARCCYDGHGWLLFNFFTQQLEGGHRKNFLPPPKRLAVNQNGRLVLRSYEHFNNLVLETIKGDKLPAYRRVFGNKHASIEEGAAGSGLACRSGYETFVLGRKEFGAFRLRCKLGIEGSGKCGLVLRMDDQANGYYLSLDLFKGVAQIRAWGRSERAEGEEAFQYRQLQAGYFVPRADHLANLEVIAYGQYLECSLDGEVLLTLVDDTFPTGVIGFYAESALLRVEDLTVEPLEAPESELF